MEAISLKMNVIISGTIEVVTGLSIGGNKDTLRIGAVDNPVIKHPKTNEPYIPGSSLKGKMRTMIEYTEGNYNTKDGTPHSFTNKCDLDECKVCVVFGSTTNKKTGITRLIVRDAQPEKYDLEIKTENAINRVEGKAEHPRDMERVTAGSRFKFEMVYSIFEKNNDKKLLKTVFEGLKLIEDTYLGANGSRGYGKVNFIINSIEVRTKEYYTGNEQGKNIIQKAVTPAEILSNKAILEEIR